MKKEKTEQLLMEIAKSVEKKDGYVDENVSSFHRKRTSNRVLLRTLLVIENRVSTEILMGLESGNETKGKVLVRCCEQYVDEKKMYEEGADFQNLEELLIQIEKQMQAEKFKAVFSGAGLHFLERLCREASQMAKKMNRFLKKEKFIDSLKEIYGTEMMGEVEGIAANLMARGGVEYGETRFEQLKLIDIETQEEIWLTKEQWLEI